MKIYFEKFEDTKQGGSTPPKRGCKTAHFSASPPSVFVATRRPFLPSRAPSARSSSVLSDVEVTICGEIVRFARTFFEHSS